MIPRIAAALTLCLAAVPAAAMDKDAAYLDTQPLTRLDYFNMHATDLMEGTFGLKDGKPANKLVFDRFAARKTFVLSASARYYAVTDSFSVVVEASTPGAATPEDCRFVLDEARSGIARMGIYGYNPDMAHAEARTNAMRMAVSQMLETPSGLVPRGQSQDLASSIASRMTVQVTAWSKPDMSDLVACHGALTGTDANLHMR